jgi:hypothetical protein
VSTNNVAFVVIRWYFERRGDINIKRFRIPADLALKALPAEGRSMPMGSARHPPAGGF